jgi:hypothetical protein
VKFLRFARYFKEVRENVSIIPEQPSYMYFQIGPEEVLSLNDQDFERFVLKSVTEQD